MSSFAETLSVGTAASATLELIESKLCIYTTNHLHLHVLCAQYLTNHNLDHQL